MSYDEWMQKVNELICEETGLNSEDMADQLYKEWYEAEVSPEEAASRVLDYEGL